MQNRAPGARAADTPRQASLKTVRIYTDGACAGNPGPGGWAALLFHAAHSRAISGAEPATTNNRMEMRAAIEALRQLREPCTVEFFTDSQYLRDGVTRWMHAWKRRKWLTANRQPVKNQDLWMELDALSARHSVNWHWLKGHAGHAENEKCDRLARKAVARLRATQTPAGLKESLREFRNSSRPAPRDIDSTGSPPA